MQFIDIFTDLCNKADKAPTTVCVELGLSDAIYTYWKKNNSTPRKAVIRKISEYFGVNEDYLLGKESSNPKEVRIDNLTDDEKQMIALMREATPAARLKMIAAFMNIKAEDEKKQGTTATA